MTVAGAIATIRKHTTMQRARFSFYRWEPAMDDRPRAHRAITFVAADEIRAGDLVSVSGVDRTGRAYVARAAQPMHLRGWNK